MLAFYILVSMWLYMLGILPSAAVPFVAIGVMLGVFIIAISSALMRGLDISCGCFSVEGGHGVAIDLLIRDILMFVGAAIVVFFGTSELTLRLRSN